MSMRIADLEKLMAEGKHVDIAPNGDVNVMDRKPYPTIKELLDKLDAEPRDESGRLERLAILTNHLSEFPHNKDNLWVWTDEEITMLRAACAKRFDESLRTESLFCIAATAIRIYLSRTADKAHPHYLAGGECW